MCVRCAQTGDEFRKLLRASVAEQERLMPNLRVLARSQPEDKRLLVKWLKDHGHVVAATGVRAAAGAAHGWTDVWPRLLSTTV